LAQAAVTLETERIKGPNPWCLWWWWWWWWWWSYIVWAYFIAFLVRMYWSVLMICCFSMTKLWNRRKLSFIPQIKSPCLPAQHLQKCKKYIVG
jgi:hypothetical protein